MRRSSPLTALFALVLLAPAVLRAQNGISPALMDTTCGPCRDFYRYANGAWLDTATFPAAYSAIGANREMGDRNTEALRRVLDRAASQARTTSDPTLRKLGDFYASCMDSTRAEREGTRPITADLRRIDAIRTRADLQREIAALHALGIFVGYYFGPEADPKESSRTIGQLYQAGLGLPDRDYYTRTDPQSDTLRQKYVAYVARMAELTGVPAARARADAERVMRLETALANASMTLVEQRDPAAIYHKMTVRELSAIAPAVDWPAYFRRLGVSSLTSPDASLDVSQPGFMKAVSAQIASAPLEDWRAYLRHHLASAAAPALDSALNRESFRFGALFSGAREQQPRWRRCAAAADNELGEAVGKAYVESEFSADSKRRVGEIVNNLQAAFADRIATLDWMSDSTKLEARRKLDAILKKIAYPDVWRDYSAVQISAGQSFADNIRATSAFETRRRLAKIGKPVDRNEWLMTPPTVNAYYNPPVNEIVFPAGILQPPRFDPTADDAVNYGAIGQVIGHELTHGFDDQGRKYDAQGNLRDWWTAEDDRRFTERAQVVVNQYDSFPAVDTLRVNGKLTLGENIADLGGLTIAYYAYMKSLEGKPRPTNVGGFTPEQRFFLGFAQAWRRKYRPELVRRIVLTDPHSPPEWRVNGPVSNMPEFARAFGCKAGDPLVRTDAQRAMIW